MKRSFMALAVSIAMSAGLIAQVPLPVSPGPSQGSDSQELVFLQPEGALRFRFHVQVDGKAPTAKWAAFLDKIYTWYDRDNDKFLTGAELSRLSNLAQLSQGFNYVFSGRPGGQQGPQVKDYDANKDGKIDREEFRAMARKMGFAPLVVQIYPPNRQAEMLTDAFYKHVNGKKDGKLTKSDLAAAWNILNKLDNDEDELVSTQELQQQPQQQYYTEVQVAYGGGRMAPQPTPSAFVSIPAVNPESVFPQLVQQLQLQKCASPFVLNLPVAPNFPKFARDLLQKIDHDTLRAWLAQPPDLEFSIVMGDVAEGLGKLIRFGKEPPGVVIQRPGGKESALGNKAATGPDGILRLTLADARIELGKGFNRTANFDGNARFYIDRYAEAAGDKKSLDKMSIQQNPYISFLANLFEDADKNADGQLHVDEFKAFLNLLKDGPSAQCYITVTDQGRALYAVLDSNNNQSLCLREVLELLKSFDKHDRNKDAALERTELLRQFRIATSIGNSGGNIRTINAGTSSAAGRSPGWFQKMDRNKDGDVSVREFFGTPEEFAAFDVDHDGLISAAEAKKIADERKTAKK